jgi:hypothetical protein
MQPAIFFKELCPKERRQLCGKAAECSNLATFFFAPPCMAPERILLWGKLFSFCSHFRSFRAITIMEAVPKTMALQQLDGPNPQRK